MSASAPLHLAYTPRRPRRARLALGAAVLHLVAAWGLLQQAPHWIRKLPLPVLQVSLVPPDAAPRLDAPAPAAAPRAAPPAWAPLPLPELRLDAPAPVIAAPPAPSPPGPAAAAMPLEPAASPPAAVAIASPAPAAAASVAPARPAAPMAPRQLDVSAVAYLAPPLLRYPPASRRAQEQGEVLVRVLVDARGLPERALLLRSSGHARLDDAALAAVHATRFRPHTENGVALPFWVVMPLLFELET